MIDLNEFVAKFAAQFEDTDASLITKDTYFHELEEWSSVMGLAIIAMIGDEYDVTIKGAELRAAETIEDAYNLVVSKL